MASSDDQAKDVLFWAMHEKKRNNGASKSNLAIAAVLATILLVSVVATLYQIGSQPAWAGTFPGANGQIVFERGGGGANFEIYKMNPDGSRQMALTNSSGLDASPSFSSDGAKIAFMSSRDSAEFFSLATEVYIMNADGTGQTRLTNNGGAHPSFSLDGTKIAFERAGGIVVMNADGSGQTPPIALGSEPNWSPDGTKIAFGSDRDGNNEIYIMNADGTGQINLTNNSASDFSASFSPDGTKIAFTRSMDFDMEVYVMNADGTGQTNISNNADAIDASPSWSPDGTKIAFMSTKDGGQEIFVMNADGTEQINLTNNSVPGFTVDSSPDWGIQPTEDNGKIVFVSSRNGIPPIPSNTEIYIMNADGTEQKRLTNNPAVDTSPSLSPDGKKIVFSRNGIVVMNTDGSGQTLLTNSGGNPSWSPDGTKIAFADVGAIYVMDADGNSTTKIFSTHSAAVSSPKWSPDGILIAFISNMNGNWEIYTIDAEGNKEPVNLTNNLADDGDPDWSPDGTKIAFTSLRDRSAEIYVMKADDGSNQTRLTASSSTPSVADIDGDPSWSPDGTKIAFVAYRDGQDADIYVMNDDGSGKTNITNDPFGAHDNEPDWGAQPNAQHSTLSVNSVDLSGVPVSGVWTVIRHATNGTVIQTGFTPFTLNGNSGEEYKLSVANYDGKIFQNWEDGSANSSRVINLASDTTITATYDTGDSLRGFTSLTYAGTEQQPDLTVNAVSLDGNKTLHMWTVIDPQTTDASSTTYKVYASNYQNIVFDHWSDDGSADRIMTITIGEAKTITAYYRAGG